MVRRRGGDVMPRGFVVTSLRGLRRDWVAERAAPAVLDEVALQTAVGRGAQKRGHKKKRRWFRTGRRRFQYERAGVSPATAGAASCHACFAGASSRGLRRDLVAERAAPAVSDEVALQTAVGQSAQERGGHEKEKI